MNCIHVLFYTACSQLKLPRNVFTFYFGRTIASVFRKQRNSRELKKKTIFTCCWECAKREFVFHKWQPNTSLSPVPKATYRRPFQFFDFKLEMFNWRAHIRPNNQTNVHRRLLFFFLLRRSSPNPIIQSTKNSSPVVGVFQSKSGGGRVLFYF